MPDVLLVLAYVVLATTVLTLQQLRKRKRPATIDLSDPYLIGYLKDGSYGVARSVLARLIAQQKLRQVGHMELIEAIPGAPEPEDELDRAALSVFREPVRSSYASATVAGNPVINKVSLARHALLQRAGLLPLAELQAEYRLSIALLVSLALASIALNYYTQTADHPFDNPIGAADGWMVFICVFFCVAAYIMSGRRSSAEHRRLLDETEQLYAGMPERVKSGAELSPQEISLTAALFGLTVFGASELGSANVFREASRPMTSTSSYGGAADFSYEQADFSAISSDLTTDYSSSSCSSDGGSSSSTDSSSSPPSSDGSSTSCSSS